VALESPETADELPDTADALPPSPPAPPWPPVAFELDEPPVARLDTLVRTSADECELDLALELALALDLAEPIPIPNPTPVEDRESPPPQVAFAMPTGSADRRAIVIRVFMGKYLAVVVERKGRADLIMRGGCPPPPR
jgi:hypothetical protein